MAVAVDASSPVRFTDASASGTGPTSASFTAPANALLVCCVETDGTGGDDPTVTVSDSGGLTWTTRVERRATETTAGAHSSIVTARTTSSAARTVLVSVVHGAATLRKSAKVYVCTGADVDGTPVDTVSASNEGGSGTNNLTTTSVTPGATGLLIVADCEWQELGAFQASSDLTQDTTTYAGAISVCDGYKACTSGVGVTANLNAGGTGTAQHKWCQIVVREAAGGGAAFLARPNAPILQAVHRASYW